MESTMLTVKFVLFLAMELFVIGVLGAVLIAGLYQIVRDKVRKQRSHRERHPFPTRAGWEAQTRP